jgi:uncharacterized protein (DUF2267 family)
MSTTGLDAFDATVQKTNELLGAIEETFGWSERRNQSYAALRAVLHAIRDRLPMEEAVQLGAQLPMLVKGVYYDGWNVNEVPVKMNRQEFVQAVREKFPFSVEGDIEEVIRAVVEALEDHIDQNQVDNVKNLLPQDLQAMMQG